MSHASPLSTRSESGPAFEELEVVYVVRDFPALDVVKGDHGTIVDIVRDPEPAYCLEFVNEDGTTWAIEFFAPDDLSRVPPAP